MLRWAQHPALDDALLRFDQIQVGGDPGLRGAQSLETVGMEGGGLEKSVLLTGPPLSLALTEQ